MTAARAARPYLLIALLTLLAMLTFRASAADVSRKELEALFTDRIADVTLSPDGRRIAYTQREGHVQSIIVRDLEPPRTRTVVFADVDEERGLLSRQTVFAIRVPFLQWADAATLVYAVSLPPKNNQPREEVHVAIGPTLVDRKVLDAADLLAALEVRVFTPRPMLGSMGEPDGLDQTAVIDVPRRMNIVGFAADVPGTLLVEAVGNLRVPHRLLRVDLTTGHRVLVGDNDGETRVLYDWSGAARVRETKRVQVDRPIPVEGRSGRAGLARPIIVPQDFEIRGAHGFWHRLDALVGSPAVARFRHSDGDEYNPRSFPLAFDANPNVLYYASNVGRDTYGLYALNTTTGKRTPFAIEVKDGDLVDPAETFSPSVLVFDRQHHLAGVRIARPTAMTQWLDPVLADRQREIDARFPGREARIIGWSDAKTRLLLSVTGGADADRYFVYEVGTPPLVSEVLRRAGTPSLGRIAAVTPFSIPTPSGATLYGSLTIPAAPRVTPPPLVVWFRDAPGHATRAAPFNSNAAALAAEGFMVLDVDYRGTAGFGAAHRDALLGRFDTVPFEDVHAAMAWLAVHHPYDRRRVATVGEGFGGYLAIRALERFPAEFRCGVGIDAPSDLVSWVEDIEVSQSRGGLYQAHPVPSLEMARRQAFYGPHVSELKPISLLAGATTLTAAVMIVQDVNRTDLRVEQGTRLRDWLTAHGRKPEYLAVQNRSEPESAARLFARIGEFLNEALFSYRVEIGHEKEVK